MAKNDLQKLSGISEWAAVKLNLETHELMKKSLDRALQRMNLNGLKKQFWNGVVYFVRKNAIPDLIQK